uniref:Uncharacterized protein n=1 Tax=Anopheles coluzzii TaxID=1518534 RepID=A0A8W7P8N6_ANOCL
MCPVRRWLSLRGNLLPAPPLVLPPGPVGDSGPSVSALLVTFSIGSLEVACSVGDMCCDEPAMPPAALPDPTIPMPGMLLRTPPVCCFMIIELLRVRSFAFAFCDDCCC